MSGRRVLVTDATSGIGAGIARAFAAAGDAVVATGATDAEVEAARGTPGIEVQRLDVRDGAAVAALVAGLGELDVVVNCAGVIRRGAAPGATSSTTGWRRKVRSSTSRRARSTPWSSTSRSARPR